jgi:RNA polymerase sigma-70 factor (ECF subfamily)
MQNYTLLDDEKLVEAARTNTDAFSVLYQRYLDRLYRYLLRRVAHVHDAEDLTMQVFNDVLDGLVSHHYRENGCFAAWLFTIARRRVADYFRQHIPEALNEGLSSDVDMHVSVENSERAQQISTLIAQLDSHQQELLRLRFSAELTFSEIALLENRTEAAVKMAFYRTLTLLRSQWEAENG